MSHSYQAIQWNRQKRIYDSILGGAVLMFIALFYIATVGRHPSATEEIVLMRGVSVAAYLLLHVILCMGPACRLQPALLPLLYNRRHAGVTLALLSWAHALLAVITYHASGTVQPWISLFVSERYHGSWSSIPFQPFGLFALAVLTLMAVTSHDYWLRNLTAPVWKALHMLVYPAYALVVIHVSLGVLQAETHPILLWLTGAGVALVTGLHVLAGRREQAQDQTCPAPNLDVRQSDSPADGYVFVCKATDIPEGRARVFLFCGERIALFRDQNRIHAVSNVCQHQNGPLGEGRIHEGCITCPWHGYQYLPDTGASPAPITESIPTFNVKLSDERVFVHPQPNPPGTKATSALFTPRTPPSASS